MDQNLRTTATMSRGNHYLSIMRTSIFAEIAVAAVIVLGNASGGALALQAIVVGVAIFAVLAGDAALKDISNLDADMDEKMASSNYGSGLRSVPFPVLRAISAVVHILIAAALFISI